MTRINLIDPALLTDQHLRAEWKEILQLCGSLRKSIASKNGLQYERIPKEFTLNTGHVYFFYDKGLYLYKRFEQIKLEMINRGWVADKIFPLNEWPQSSINDWKPTEKDYKIIKERILLRISQKPDWYKYKGEKINFSKIKEWYS